MISLNPALTVLFLMACDEGCRQWARHAVKPEWFDVREQRDLFAIAAEYDQPEPFCAMHWAREYARRSGCDVKRAALMVARVLEFEASPVNVSAYATMLRDDYERREMAKAARMIAERANDPTIAPGDMAGVMRSAAELVSAREADDVVLGDELADAANRTRSGYVPTGFRSLDEMLLGGYYPQRLNLVAARPSVGKTAFAMDLLRHARGYGIPSGIISLEMDPEALASRLNGVFGANAADVRCHYPKGACGTNEIYAKLRQWRADGLGLAVIDYAGLIAKPKARSFYEATTAVSHELKRIAVAVEIPLVVLVQLSRAPNQRKDPRPLLSDLRDTGAWEEDADTVVMLHRPGQQNQQNDDPEAWAFLAKNRTGPTGVARLHWIARMTTFAGTEAQQ